jgi:arylamine N-acetyltransferase
MLDVQSIAMPRWHKSNKPAPPPQEHVLIRITNQAGKYATLSGKGDLLVAPKAQAAEFTVTEAPRRQRELERRGFKTKVEPV